MNTAELPGNLLTLQTWILLAGTVDLTLRSELIGFWQVRGVHGARDKLAGPWRRHEVGRSGSLTETHSLAIVGKPSQPSSAKQPKLYYYCTLYVIDALFIFYRRP